MNRHSRLAVLTVITVSLLGALANTADAQLGMDTCAHFGRWGASLHGSGWYESPYAMGRIPTPPYFALHPPVYYSEPVARTYGYSPYPYPGTMQTPEIVAPPEPQEVLNPHVSPPNAAPTHDSPEEDSNDQVAHAEPQWITNPFVVPTVAEN